MIKRGQVQLFDIIAGIVIMTGGLIVALGLINLGSLITSLGLIMELIKLVLEKGL